MRFLADMGVSFRIAAWLRSQGHDAVHLGEAGLHRLPDGEIFRKAFAEGRIVLTFDLDFSEILAFSAGDHASVVLFRLRNTRTDHVRERLSAVLPDAGPALEKGAVVVVEESRYRIRTLPLR